MLSRRKLTLVQIRQTGQFEQIVARYVKHKAVEGIRINGKEENRITIEDKKATDQGQSQSPSR